MMGLTRGTSMIRPAVLLMMAMLAHAQDLTCGGVFSSNSLYYSSPAAPIASNATTWCCNSGGNSTSGPRGGSLTIAGSAINGPCHVGGAGGTGPDSTGKIMDVYTNCPVSRGSLCWRPQPFS